MSRKEIGERLRELRGDKTIREVSRMTGISESAIAMYERGERNPRDELKLTLAKCYGRTVSEIFYPEEHTICAE